MRFVISGGENNTDRPGEFLLFALNPHLTQRLSLLRRPDRHKMEEKPLLSQILYLALDVPSRELKISTLNRKLCDGWEGRWVLE